MRAVRGSQQGAAGQDDEQRVREAAKVLGGLEDVRPEYTEGEGKGHVT